VWKPHCVVARVLVYCVRARKGSLDMAGDDMAVAPCWAEICILVEYGPGCLGWFEESRMISEECVELTGIKVHYPSTFATRRPCDQHAVHCCNYDQGPSISWMTPGLAQVLLSITPNPSGAVSAAAASRSRKQQYLRISRCESAVARGVWPRRLRLDRWLNMMTRGQ
jgi:hypothetical protein